MNKILRKIIETCSVPGNEDALREYLIKKMKSYGTIKKTRWTDFYCEHKNNRPDKKTRIVVTAHMDSPGFIVQEIQENGSLTAITLGGISPQKMGLRPVQVHTSQNIYPGILQVDANDSEKSRPKYNVFCGFNSAKDAEKAGVQKGDSICFDPCILELQNNLVAAPCLDDRLGIFLMLEIAKKLANEDLDCNLYFAGTGCEEISGRGAQIISNMIQPHIALCLDTTYEENSVKMGKGPVFTMSDASTFLSRKTRDTLLDISKKAKVNCQMEVYNYASTDAAAFCKAEEGCISIPILLATLNNHSPHEIFSTKDLDTTKKFSIAIIQNHQKLLA